MGEGSVEQIHLHGNIAEAVQFLLNILEAEMIGSARIEEDQSRSPEQDHLCSIVRDRARESGDDDWGVKKGRPIRWSRLHACKCTVSHVQLTSLLSLSQSSHDQLTG